MDDDHTSIAQLLIRYCHALDLHDWPVLENDVFTLDAVIDLSAVGRGRVSVGEFIAWLKHVLGGFTFTQHFVMNPDARVDGHLALCRSSFLNPNGIAMESETQRTFIIGGYYIDKMRKTPAGWRIEERVEQPVWQLGELPSLPQPGSGG
jgi:hypothetical protein